MNLSDPFTKEELKNAVGTLKENLYNSFNENLEIDFFRKPETGWSLAENIQHMNRVTKILTLSFATPKFLASVVFGETGEKARRLSLVADVYLDALRKGFDAGPFTPKKENIDGNLPVRKNDLLEDWNKAWGKYSLALEHWNEEQLDKILMPHPFLGKIPAREMYMVGMLHPIHHSEIVSKRIGKVWNYF